MSDSESPKPEKSNLTFVQTVFSVLAAFFGVQKEENRIRDFEKGSAVHFIVIGIISIVLFVFTLVFIVSRVLA